MYLFIMVNMVGLISHYVIFMMNKK